MYNYWKIVRVAPISAPSGVRTHVARESSAPEVKVLTTGPPVVPYTSVIGAEICSTNFSFLNNYVNISKVQFYSVVCNLIAVVHMYYALVCMKLLEVNNKNRYAAN